MAKIVRVEGKKGISWRIDYFDPNGKRIRRMFKKKKYAVAELGKRVSLMAEGRYLDIKKDTKTTLSQLIDRYGMEHKNQKSYQKNKKKFAESFKEYMGVDTLISQITWKKIAEYRSHPENKPTWRKKTGGKRKPSTVNRELNCLHQMFTEAVEWEMIERSPFEGKRNVFRKEPDHRIRYLTKKEIERLLAECEFKPYLRRIVVFAINTGLGRGDILKLKWDDIKKVTLMETGQKVNMVCVRRGKTDKLVEIPLNEEVEAVLKEIRLEQGLNKNENIFTRDGQPIKRIDGAYTAALRRAGLRSPDIEKNVDFKSLRHTFASHLVMEGRSLKEVQELLGHKQITMTLRYAHLAPQKKVEAVHALNGLTGYIKSDMSEIDRFSEKNDGDPSISRG